MNMFESTFYKFLRNVFAVSLLWTKGYLVGQESNNDSVSYNLPEIVITASPILVPTPNIIREYNFKDFESWNSHNVAEALTQSVGLNIQSSGSTGAAHVWMRGFRHRDIQVLFDGIPISSAFEGHVDLNEVAINNIAKIKVIKGAPSVIYGINAMGGVIDIIPKTTSDGQPVQGTVEVGKYDTRLFRVNFGNYNKLFNCSISANYEARSGYSLSDNFVVSKNEDGGLRENSDYLRKNLLINLNYRIQSVGNYSIFYNLSANERGFPPQVGIINPDYERYKSKRQTISFINRFSFFPVFARAFYNSYHNESETYKDSTYSEMESSDDAKDYVYGVNLYSNLVTSKSNVIILNLSFKNDGYESEGDLENQKEAQIRTYTFAAEDEFSIKDKLTISAGGILGIARQTNIDRNISVFDAQLVVGYELTKNVITHVSIAKRTRFPSLREFYREKYGNPNLTEQKAMNYEVGIKFTSHPHIQTDFALFLTNLNGLIERRTSRSIYENLQKAIIKGIEFSSGGWISNNSFARIGYTLLDADEVLAKNLSRPLRNRPNHSVEMELRHRFPSKSVLNLNGIYVAELFDADDNGSLIRLSNYFLVNTKISQSFMPNAEAYIAISNITDISYEDHLGFPREGRAWRLGLNFNF